MILKYIIIFKTTNKRREKANLNAKFKACKKTKHEQLLNEVKIEGKMFFALEWRIDTNVAYILLVKCYVIEIGI